jgi:hypothetical protein
MAAKIEDLISPDYQEQMRLMHAQQPWGLSGRKYIEIVAGFYDELGAGSLLDYGSGSELLRKGLEARDPPISVSCYDPGIEGRDALPQPADLVTVTDVMEHIQHDRLAAVLNHIFSLARKGVFFSIAMSYSKQYLPNGTNAHILVRKMDWWQDALNRKGWEFRKAEDLGKQAHVWMVRV